MRKLITAILLVILLNGISIADFVDNGNGTVTDTTTGLMWQKETAPGTYTWQQALEYAESLIFPLNGYSDWRLPNINELQTLLDHSNFNPAIYPIFKPHTVSSDYCSSTSNIRHSHFASSVDFYYGYVGDFAKPSICYVRAVRAGK
jgi:hypothetical protein